MKKLLAYSGIFLLLAPQSCKKENNGPGTLSLDIVHQVDDVMLTMDTMRYANAAGEQYSVTRLDYYLSNLRFYKNGNEAFRTDTILSVDARNTNRLVLRNMPSGNYDSMSYFIGIDSAHNIEGMIPNTLWNVNMGWPFGMGGGYHFMKLEGYWQDAQNPSSGYTMHLGNNANLVRGGKALSLNIPGGGTRTAALIMDINEWYKNPKIYSFNADGAHSMYAPPLMRKLRENGKDVLSLHSVLPE